MTLFRRFLLFFLFAALLPLAGVGWRVGSVTERRLRDEALRLQKGLADQAARDVQETIEGYLDVLTIAARQPLILDRETYRAVLSSLLTRYPFLLDVGLYTLGGQDIYVLNRSAEPGSGRLWDAAGEPEVLTRGWGVSDVETVTDGATLRLAVGLEPTVGRVAGVLAARVSLVGLEERLQTAAHAGGAHLRLEDAQNRRVAGGPPPRGGDLLTVRVPVPGFPWTVVWDRPTEEVFALAREIQRELRLSLWLGGSIAVLLCLALTRWLVGSLLGLETAIRDMKEGRFDRPPSARGRDEIGRLASELRDAQIVLARQVRQSTLGLLVHRVIHDLRQPFAVVRNSLDMVRRHVTGADEVANKHFTLIANELERSATTMEDLSALGRTKPPRRSPLNLNVFLKDVMGSWPLPSDIRLLWRLDPTISDGHYDECQLRRAVINLVQNAQEALPNGGTITLETAEEDNTQIVRVQDDGIGVDSEDPTRIFQDFFSTKSGGTGLGLGIVQSVVEGHGGRVHVRRAAGHGTVFEILLPRGTA